MMAQGMTSHFTADISLVLFFVIIITFQKALCTKQEVNEEFSMPGEDIHVKHPKHQPQENNLDVDDIVLNVENVEPIDKISEESTANINFGATEENTSEEITDTNIPGGIEGIQLEKESATNIGDTPVFENDRIILADSDKKTDQYENDININESVDSSIVLDDKNDVVITENKDNVVSADESEKEIPSFKEYREQKEKETGNDDKRKTDLIDEAPVDKPKGKVIQKNYADNSCGANIVDKKKGFKNCDAILNNNKDLYGMIACDGSIWFVVELCDTVQIQAIQLANHELFSSSVQEFRIYTAENYPPKEWLLIGTFETVNNREVQNFDIENHGEYSKYVKFEKVSSRGKEHFCVLSKFGVLGISMVDEYEEQQMPQEVDIDPYDQPLNEVPEEIVESINDKSLIEGAKDAVKNIVDSALNVLGVSKNEDKTEPRVAKNLPEEDTEIISYEEVQVIPIEESVVTKLDEAGKEIKDVLSKESEKRLKGEVAEQVEKNENYNDSENMKKFDTLNNSPQQEPIMEGVDPSGDSSELQNSLNDMDLKTVNLLEDNLSHDEGKLDLMDNRETMEGFEKLHEENNGKSIVEKSQDVEKDGKGVVMTNSPKKNSIFVDLDKKIRELQKDLSLSNDYLETLSSRYKRVDNLFKPLEKTLSTVDEAIIDFEKRLKSLEAKFEKFDDAVDLYTSHMNELNTKSNTLITTTNLILFLLLLILYIFWRTSNKVQQILYCVMPKSKPNPSLQDKDKSGATNDSLLSHKRTKPKSKDLLTRKRDPSPDVVKSNMSESSISNSKQIFSVENRKLVDNKKPLESVQMDLIYPQAKSPTLKRRSSKHVR